MLTDEQVDALIAAARVALHGPGAENLPVTGDDRAIFRAGMLEAARMLTDNGHAKLMPDEQDIEGHFFRLACAIRAAAGG